LIGERQTVLQLLRHESASLKKRIQARIESNQEQLQHYSDANLAAANLHAMRETTLKYAEDAVKKGI
jgi:hypothetical protein